MEIKFKHLIVLTVLLAMGQFSFGQNKKDTTGQTGLEYWYEWWEKNYENNGDGSFTEEQYSAPSSKTIEIEEKKSLATRLL